MFYWGNVQGARNPHYPEAPDVRTVRAGETCQLPELNDNVSYQAIRDRLDELRFLTDPTVFPSSAAL